MPATKLEPRLAAGVLAGSSPADCQTVAADCNQRFSGCRHDRANSCIPPPAPRTRLCLQRPSVLPGVCRHGTLVRPMHGHPPRFAHGVSPPHMPASEMLADSLICPHCGEQTSDLAGCARPEGGTSGTICRVLRCCLDCVQGSMICITDD